MRLGSILRLGDYIVIAVVFVLGISTLAYNLYFHEGYEHKYVEVYVQNELVKEISLNEQDERIYEIPFEAGGEIHYAKVEVKDGQVRMLPQKRELSPRQIHAHTGWISHEYETIVDMPNQILVSFADVGKDAESDLDGVTY